MRVRDLGPLAIEGGGREQPVVGTKGAAMLALLVIHVNQQVSVDALTAAAWGEHAPAGAASTLLSHIWRLRQLVEPDRPSGAPPQILLNDAGGYRLVGTAQTVDSLFFVEAGARVRDDLAAGRLDAALRGSDEALGRWRGRPYGRAADADWARPAVARLDEMRAQVQERRIRALVGLGALDTALSDLRPLIAAMPFHETLRVLQMEALHRSGRTEQALQSFAEARRILVDEIGIEPGRDLQDLHRRILDGDTADARPPGPAVPSAGDPEHPPIVAVQTPQRWSAGVHLPPTPTALIGRDAELPRLVGLVEAHRLVTLTGPAGCGKTRVAVEVARLCAEDFADGVWFIDLVGVDDPALVVEVVASTIGFVPSAVGTPVQDLQWYLASRRALVVLDNCEHLLVAVAAMVHSVLGDPIDHAGSRILATSRQRLGVAGEVGWTLEPLELPRPDADDETDTAAVRLLVQRLREANPSLEVDQQSRRAVVRICHALDGLPLPLELAAARASTFSLAEIADQVSADPGRLRRPGRSGREHRATLHSTIEWSYRLLTDRERAAHRRLSVLPGPFTEVAAAAVLGADADDTVDVLVELVHRSMLARVGAARPGRRTTFRQLVTVRGHAGAGLRASAENAEITARRDRFAAALILRRPPLGTTAEPAWFDALDDDYPTVRAALSRHLIDQPAVGSELLAAPLAFYWYYRGKLVEATRWLTLEHDLLRDGDQADRAVTGLALSAVLTLQGRHERARPLVDAALTVHPTTDRQTDAMAELLIGLVAAAWVTDHHALLVEIAGRLEDLVLHRRSDHLQLLVDAVDVMALAVTGRPGDARRRAAEVQTRAGIDGVPMASWLASGPPLAAALFSGRPDEGIPWAERCMAAHFPSGTGAGGAFIETRANFAAQQHEYTLAARLYGAAQAITRRVGMRWPWRQLSLELLQDTRSALAAEDFERYWQDGQRLTPLGVLDGLRHGWDD